MKIVLQKKVLKYILLIAGIVFFKERLVSQSSADSLKQVLNQNLPDTEKVYVYHEIAMDYYASHPDSAIKYWRIAISFADRAIKKAESIEEKNTILQGQSYALGGLSFMMQQEMKEDSAVMLMERSLRNFIELGDAKGAAQITLNLSSYYSGKANYQKAIELSNEVVQLSKKAKDFRTLGFAYQNIGLSYSNWGNIPKAIEYFGASLRVRDSIKDYKGLGNAYFELAIIYRTQNEVKEAMEYFKKSYEFRRKVNDVSGLGATENEIGSIYLFDLNDLGAAKTYFDSSRLHLERIDDKEHLGYLYANLGGYFKIKNDLDSALLYFDKALAIRKAIGEMKGYYLSVYQLGVIHFMKKNYDKAIELGLQAYKGGEKIENIEIINKTSNLLRNAYKEKGNYKEAYRFLEIYKSSSDSVLNAGTQRLTLKNRMNFEFEKKEEAMKAQQEKEVLILTNERDKQKTRTVFSIVLLVIMTVFSVLIFNRFRLTRRQKAIIEDQRKDVTHQKNIIELKQKEILDSIHYARRIQTALITSEKYIAKNIDRLKK